MSYWKPSLYMRGVLVLEEYSDNVTGGRRPRKCGVGLSCLGRD